MPREARAGLALIGIAESRRDEGVVRTAILSAFGELHLVTVGEAVTLRYRVTAVSADAVELADLTGGPPLRLVLP
jgi:hypothetical protein